MNEDRPTFAVMGTGGVGGYFGARLAEAGYPVSFIARGAHLEAIQSEGLFVDSPEGSIRIIAPATDSAADIGPVDFVLMSVKLWDTETAAAQIKPLIGPDTAVLSLQNGIDSEDILGAELGQDHVLGGVAQISAFITAPGHIEKLSAFHRIQYGELDGRQSARCQRLEHCLNNAGIDADYSQDIVSEIWKKFIFLTGLSALTALTRKSIGPVRDDPDTRALLSDIMSEVYMVARAKGIALDDDLVAQRMHFVDSLPADMQASMAVDLEQGRRLELPWLSGAVVRLGLELNLPTPANTFVTTALKLHVNGAGSEQG